MLKYERVEVNGNHISVTWTHKGSEQVTTGSLDGLRSWGGLIERMLDRINELDKRDTKSYEVVPPGNDITVDDDAITEAQKIYKQVPLSKAPGHDDQMASLSLLLQYHRDLAGNNAVSERLRKVRDAIEKELGLDE